jgi:hypothetical protein
MVALSTPRVLLQGGYKGTAERAYNTHSYEINQQKNNGWRTTHDNGRDVANSKVTHCYMMIFIEQDLIPKKDRGAYNHV